MKLASVVLLPVALGPLTAQRPVDLGAAQRVANDIDQAVLKRLARFGIEPAPPCSDADFVRRVFLDLNARLPEAKRCAQFLADRHPDKRNRLVAELLASRHYADAWALKLSDMLRIKAEFPIKLWPNAAQAYYQWLWTALRENRPWSKIAEELLTATGSNFRDPPANFYRAVQRRTPSGIASAVALGLLGQRSEHWTEARRHAFAAFFARVAFKPTQEWKEEIVYHDPYRELPKGSPGADGTARIPGAGLIHLDPELDPRTTLARGLLDPKNPLLARAMANRVWFWLLGRGVVHEADDLRDDNPPSNPELLAVLTGAFQRSGHDLQLLIAGICLSRTYQRSCERARESPLAEAQFAYCAPRRLDAELLIDAICQITGVPEQYTSQVPEPFTFVPSSRSATTLPDGSISSPFLEMFGRPTRDTGLLSERNTHVTPTQRLHLLNSSHVRQKLESSRTLRRLFQTARGNVDRVADDLYLTFLSRYPTPEERRAIAEFDAGAEARGREAFLDLAWALLNTSEFQLRH